MKQFLLIFLLLSPAEILAKPKLWFSNKSEFGYGKTFIAEQITFENGVFTENKAAAGLKFKISNDLGYKTFYFLQNSKKNNWSAEHFLGLVFCLKMQ